MYGVSLDITADTSWSQRIIPLVVLPEQMASPARGQALLSPVLGLMAAVLEDAAHICRSRHTRCSRRGRTLIQETEAWFQSEDREWLFSFRNVCDALDLDPRAVRDAVLGPPLEWRPKRRRRAGGRVSMTVEPPVTSSFADARSGTW
jgi:hypothetical protein